MLGVGGVGEGALCWVWVGWARELCGGQFGADGVVSEDGLGEV